MTVNSNMPERDAVGMAAMRAGDRLSTARKRVREAMPIGPGKVRLTRAELGKALRSASPEDITALQGSMSQDEFARLLGSLRAKPSRVSSMKEFLHGREAGT